jgi:hypothetical protein
VVLPTVEACGRLGRSPRRQRVLVGLVAAASLAAYVAWSPSPIGLQFRSGIWAQPQARHAATREAIRLVPSAAGVAATYNLVPHLTHRTRIYEFPNPWVITNWGVRGERPPDERAVDYLVVDTSLNGASERLFQQLVGPGGKFRVVYDRDGIVVAQRTKP